MNIKIFNIQPLIQEDIGRDLSFYHDKVVIRSLKSLGFSDKKKRIISNENNLPWKKLILKICFNNKKIYRLYNGTPIAEITEKTVGLTWKSLLILNYVINDEKQIKKVRVKVSSPKTLLHLMWYRFQFYRYHPDDAVRVSIKSAFIYFIITILLAIVGIIIVLL